MSDSNESKDSTDKPSKPQASIEVVKESYEAPKASVEEVKASDSNRRTTNT